MRLVQPLFQGPIDVVADVHGEIDAFQELLDYLGYAANGSHPEGRRTVFLGDLTDRGPDSPAVLALVEGLLRSGRAQCVLGNHDLNLLLGDLKHDNCWFFGIENSLDRSGVVTPQALADESLQSSARELFVSLPLVLERNDIRIVHACWSSPMVELARQADDVIELYESHRRQIDSELDSGPELDAVDRDLAHQNRNPVKVLTSGFERRAQHPGDSSEWDRHEERVPWWLEYSDNILCVFGHYARLQGQTDGSAHAICIDYGVGKRWRERQDPAFDGDYQTKLAALRLPERILVFDNGERVSLEAV